MKPDDDSILQTTITDTSPDMYKQMWFSLYIVCSCAFNFITIIHVKPLTVILILIVCSVYAILLAFEFMIDRFSKSVVVFLAILLYVVTQTDIVIELYGTAFLLFISVSNAYIVYNIFGKKRFRLLYSLLFVVNIAVTLLISKTYFNEVLMVLQIPIVFFYSTALVFLWFCAANIAYDHMENIEVFLYKYLPIIMCLMMMIMNMNCLFSEWNANHKYFYEFQALDRHLEKFFE